MSLIREDVTFDVTSALPAGAETGPVHVAATVVADPDRIPVSPLVIVAIPGGTYHRRYWDLQPPDRIGYSQAQWAADRGAVFVACDYLGGGDSSRPENGDFMTLRVCAAAAHAVLGQLKGALAAGSLIAGLPNLTDPLFVGIGQSLGGFITMIQQGEYADYSGIAVLGASPLLIANIPAHRSLAGLSEAERRQALLEDNAKTAGVGELPVYHGAPHEFYRGIFHTLDVPDDLFDYDVQRCHTLINRMTGVDGMTPGYAKPFADRITTPIFLGFGDSDVSQQPRLEPTGYPSARDITVVVIPHMAHMHNFADTREQLWRRLGAWMAALR